MSYRHPAGHRKVYFKPADVISSASLGIIEKIKTKCDKKVDFLPNWADVSVFFSISEKAKLKSEFGFQSSDKISLYSGTPAVAKSLN